MYWDSKYKRIIDWYDTGNWWNWCDTGIPHHCATRGCAVPWLAEPKSCLRCKQNGIGIGKNPLPPSNEKLKENKTGKSSHAKFLVSKPVKKTPCSIHYGRIRSTQLVEPGYFPDLLCNTGLILVLFSNTDLACYQKSIAFVYIRRLYATWSANGLGKQYLKNAGEKACP